MRRAYSHTQLQLLQTGTFVYTDLGLQASDMQICNTYLCLFADVKIFWHPQGDYLAVKVDRFTKTKKSTYTGFELFSIREKDIPMDVSVEGRH